MIKFLDLKNYKNRHSLKSKVARAAWNVVWLLLFRPTPNTAKWARAAASW